MQAYCHSQEEVDNRIQGDVAHVLRRGIDPLTNGKTTLDVCGTVALLYLLWHMKSYLHIYVTLHEVKE